MLIYKRIQQSLKTRWLLFKDHIEIKLGNRHPLIPPKRYDYLNIGTSDKINREFFNYFLEIGDLKPSDQVLEVGSGFGRMAIPLTEYLSPNGHYYGLELIRDGVNWCQHNFTPKYPNFKFQRIDVYNERYHPEGTQKANNYHFPFEDNSFDFVYLTSVFTHMYPDEIANYLKEISRVMKPGAKCLCTYYLVNEVSANYIHKRMGTYNFEYTKGDSFIEDLNDPLYQIAFKEEFIKMMYRNCKLHIESPIHYGSWSGRQDFLSFQDIIVAKKIKI